MAVFEAVLKATNLTQESGNYFRLTKTMISILNSYKTVCYKLMKDIDFNKAHYRRAYCFLFFTSHAYTIKHIFQEAEPQLESWLADIVDRKLIKVVSVGGGPAPEIVGLLLFLRRICPDIQVESLVLDKYDWRASFEGVLDQLGITGVRIRYELTDVTDERMDFTRFQHELESCDLLMFIKSLSAINYGRNMKVQANVTRMLQSLEEGAIVLQVDNMSSVGILPETFGSNGFNELFSNNAFSFWLEHNEYQAMHQYVEFINTNSNPVIAPKPQYGTYATVAVTIASKRIELVVNADHMMSMYSRILNVQLGLSLYFSN